MRFSVGVNYWPQRSGMAMWQQFDAGEIREDFARIAGLGLDTVRFFLRWDAFQPQPQTIDPVMLDRLEEVVEIAAGAGLRTMPVLFCGHMSGANWLPSWTLDANGIRNMYAGRVLEAQLVFARAAGERLRGHPAVVAWDLANKFSNVQRPAQGKLRTGSHETEPAAEREVAEWSRRLTSALEETSSLPATAGTHSYDLTQDRNIRLGSLCAPFAFASMQGSSVECAFARNRLDPEAVPFLAMLAAAFSFKPVLMTGFGNPTCPDRKFSLLERLPAPDEPPNDEISPDDPVFASYACLNEDENAAYCTSVLERLHADGRLGAYWWRWADYPEESSAEAPFDRAPHERFYGIIRSDGTEKPVAAALAAFAREQREVVASDDMPMISSEYYYRTVPKSTQTLYEAFLGYVQPRRER